MKTRSRPLWFIASAALLPLFNLTLATPVFAQEETGQPRVMMTMLLVEEKCACRDNGYLTYDNDEPSRCKPFSAKDIPTLEGEALVDIQTEPVPPSEVKLGNDLYQQLNTYSTTGKSTAEDRRAIVLVFKWDGPQSGKVTLQRVSEYGDIPGMTWKGVLRGEKLWINHERADAFLPGYGLKWILTLGKNTWVFETGVK